MFNDLGMCGDIFKKSLSHLGTWSFCRRKHEPPKCRLFTACHGARQLMPGSASYRTKGRLSWETLAQTCQRWGNRPSVDEGKRGREQLREKWAKYTAAAVVYHWVHKTEKASSKSSWKSQCIPHSLQRQSFDAETHFLSLSIHPFSLPLSPTLPPFLPCYWWIKRKYVSWQAGRGEEKESRHQKEFIQRVSQQEMCTVSSPRL